MRTYVRRSGMSFVLPLVGGMVLWGCGLVDDGAIDETGYGGPGKGSGTTVGAGGASGGKGGAAGSTGGTGGSTGGKGGTGGSVGGSGGSAAGGSAGFAGSAGSAAVGGSAGFAGSAGSAAVGGSAGFSGSAGSAAGGSAGFAGVGGSAGFSGSAGFGGGGFAGEGGSAGFAGEGGSAGFAGEGGSAGFAGEGGSAGFAGEGGSAGFAGEGGSAGFAGEGGSAGFAGEGGSGGFAGEGGSGGTGGGPVGCVDPNPDPNSDDDKDGWSAAQGDCNDCDPNVNPGAVDIVNYVKNAEGKPTTIPLPDDQQVDEDCSGAALLPGQSTSCDSGLGPDAFSAFDAARAMGLCNVFVPENPPDPKDRKWGVIDAKFSAISGPFLKTPPPLSSKPMNLNYGLLPDFGPATKPFEGERIFALSSGQARAPGQPGYRADLVEQFDKGYSSAFPGPSDFGQAGPPWFPKQGACGTTGQPHDGVAIDMKIRVPTNAKSFSFQFRFFTDEYPVFVCQVYNDVFAVLMDPSPLPMGDPMYPDIAFETTASGGKNVIGVNNQSFLTACTKGASSFPYPNCQGQQDLQGSGYEGHAASAWLRNIAPVTPGQIINLRFAIWDSADGVLDSSAVIDDFRWRAEEGTLGTVISD